MNQVRARVADLAEATRSEGGGGGRLAARKRLNTQLEEMWDLLEHLHGRSEEVSGMRLELATKEREDVAALRADFLELLQNRVGCLSPNEETLTSWQRDYISYL